MSFSQKDWYTADRKRDPERYKQYGRNFHARRKAAGICVKCGAAPAVVSCNSVRRVINHCLPCRTRYNVARSQNRLAVKIEVLTHYGPDHQLRCNWDGCDIVDVDMLSLDHINNDGAADRENCSGGIAFYKQVKSREYPNGFQTLCYNHQWKKETMRRRASIEQA